MKLLIHSLMFAALAATAETATKTPSITPETRAKFWRAYAEQTAAAASAQRAVENMKAVEVELRAACGANVLAMDDKGEPTCKVKESPAPAPAK
jgi:hypothetical protein